MDRTIRRLMGISLEFNRLLPKKYDISLTDYLVCNGIPFCHNKTYQKVVAGEYTRDELYIVMLKKRGLTFNYDESIQIKLKEKYVYIKKAIEFIDKKQLAKQLNSAIRLMENDKDVYPHKMEYYILIQLKQFFICDEILDDKVIRILSFVLKVASTKSRAILIYLIYFNMHRKNALISSLKTTFDSLPLFDQEDMLIQLVITKQMIYEKDFKMALQIANKLEANCLQSNNLSRLCDVYQNMIAIYEGIENWGNVIKYVKALENLLSHNDELSDLAIQRSEYYLGMCSFRWHYFEEAFAFLSHCIQKNPDSYTLTLYYLCCASYLNVSDIYYEANTISLVGLNNSQRVFLQYFINKLKGKRNKELRDYIVNKIIPILSEDYFMEAYVFKQELYLRDGHEEMALFNEKMDSLNYVILQNWVEVFSKL